MTTVTNIAEAIHFRAEWGLFWPNYDFAPERTYHYVQKHLADVLETIKICPRHRLCVQAGGHVGIWPALLATQFDLVMTFEPDPALFAALKRNMRRYQNVRCFPWALGDTEGKARMLSSVKAGNWAIDPKGDHEVDIVTLDRVARGLEVDCLILDIEGHEAQALAGAREIVGRDHPVIHVEELPRHARATRDALAALGYREHHRAGRDGVYIWV